ncbi:MAG TPA: hypothetical protein VGM34_03875 [Chlamydiales bacterium]
MAQSIQTWADSGARQDMPFVDLQTVIGADEGVETSWVEIYYGGEIGSHIRPKSRASIESMQKKASNPVKAPTLSQNRTQEVNLAALSRLLEGKEASFKLIYQYLSVREYKRLFGSA